MTAFAMRMVMPPGLAMSVPSPMAVAVIVHLLGPVAGTGSEAGRVRGLQTIRLQVVMGFPVVSGWLHVLRPF
ncbi:hypothetical protein A6024_05155 [Rhodovulum sulfidophilum]|nr:hypothetical protein A6W98_05305 [Rhodovulum sulfidophilum DSM 1374]ANB37364.1 hypothetical protein A6024_05155 [Rhodovulum sulfidophilum]